jgi:hypothetical protein
VRGHAEELILVGEGLTKLADEEAIRKVGEDAGDGFAGGNGFGEVIDASCFEAGDDVVIGVACSDEDHRRAIGAITTVDLATSLDPIDTGKTHVHDDEIGLEVFAVRQSGFAGVEFVPFGFEQTVDHRGVYRVIVDDENLTALKLDRGAMGEALVMEGTKWVTTA